MRQRVELERCHVSNTCPFTAGPIRSRPALRTWRAFSIQDPRRADSLALSPSVSLAFLSCSSDCLPVVAVLVSRKRAFHRTLEFSGHRTLPSGWIGVAREPPVMDKKAGKTEKEAADRRKYPIRQEDYELCEEVGQGASAVVYRARCIPFNEIVAIKVLDFEKAKADLVISALFQQSLSLLWRVPFMLSFSDNIRREAQTMILVDHPNVLKAHCSFVSDHNLWVVMPYMAGGSCLHILKAAFPDGLEETVIATVLREVLKGLAYLHHHGHIHRDVKAGNILVDVSGGIKLGDFGVSACLFDSGDRQRSRNTFVGTPCWMAPEVMEQLHGYDFKADIWSFGITALELAHGHAPFSKYPPMKVLLMTLQNAPPGLDYERDKKFSKVLTHSFKQMIAMCLVKDPSRRPSAEKLLKHPFFKHARSIDYLARTILEGLPSLGDRIKALKDKEADMLAQKKMPDGQKEEISQNEYKRGISGWNFNIEDVKAQASLIQDVDEILASKDQIESSNTLSALENMEGQAQLQSSFSGDSLKDEAIDQEGGAPMRPWRTTSFQLSGSNFSMLDGKLNGSLDEVATVSPPMHEEIKQNGFVVSDSGVHDMVKATKGDDSEIDSKSMEELSRYIQDKKGLSNGQLPSDLPPPRGESQLQISGFDSFSRLSSNADELGDKTKVPVVQQRGRFKVTSESATMEKSLPSPHLQKSQSLQDCVWSMMKEVGGDISSGNCACTLGQKPSSFGIGDKSLLEAAYEREKELVQDLADTKWRLICVTEEMQKLKTRNAQIQVVKSFLGFEWIQSSHTGGGHAFS
ncbi:Serine/threonine-protein kinase [Nymphaea thermarum]|nr:Serine/threonine-protein kinase [Nymphaea thermarum]